MWTCLLAYNLIRQTMLQSAQGAGVSPRTLSFTAALQTIGTSWLVMVLGDDVLTSRLVDAALATMPCTVWATGQDAWNRARSNADPRSMPYSPSHARKHGPNY